MLSNQAILLASAGTVAAVALLLLVSSQPGAPTAPAGNLSVQPPDATPGEAPRVVSVQSYIADLSAEQRACLDSAIGAGQAAALQRGEASVTDQQLQALNDCVNLGLPNPADVVQ